jgi:hypothetical protein
LHYIFLFTFLFFHSYSRIQHEALEMSTPAFMSFSLYLQFECYTQQQI